MIMPKLVKLVSCCADSIRARSLVFPKIRARLAKLR